MYMRSINKFNNINSNTRMVEQCCSFDEAIWSDAIAERPLSATNQILGLFQYEKHTMH